MIQGNHLEHTPMIQQYLRIKSEYKNYLLFYRMGDFYELFFEDAVKAAKLLNITLTKRGKKDGQDISMAGVPCHTVDSYIHKLIKLGETVVICEQLGEVNTKGPMDRQVTRIITPGTVTEEELLPGNKANLIVAILKNNLSIAIAVLDVSTGLFKISSVNNDLDLAAELERLSPSEIILPKEFAEYKPAISSIKTTINYIEQVYFTEKKARNILNEHFNKEFCNQFIKNNLLYNNPGYLNSLCAAGALLYYVKSVHKNSLAHIQQLQLEFFDDAVIIDQQTRRNLEISSTIQNYQDNNKSNTLLKILDNCKTAMGSRLIFNWLNRPIKNHHLLNQRYEAIKILQQDSIFEDFRDVLVNITDIERIISRIAILSAKPRDLLQLKQSFRYLPQISDLLKPTMHKGLLLQKIFADLRTFPKLYELIDKAIIANPPIILKEGNFIADGYDKELDELRLIYNDADSFLHEIESTERVKTKLSSLKIGFNKIHGYYIEVSRNQSKFLPNNYIRRQTLKNVERFISPELKQLEDRIISSKTRAIAREKFLFEELLKTLQQHIMVIQETAAAIAILDALTTFAERAITLNWLQPTLTTEEQIYIEAGRHPVVEQLQSSLFIPNNMALNLATKMLIITGPNMGGKSTYMRQSAIIVLLALIGSFVPANKAIIGPIDRIFSRIGASDDLAQGKSTFMIEMLETANILNYATTQSLVIIDEIGRGTSTFDGLSLAYAVAKHLANNNNCFCLFATHYLELTALATEVKQIANVHLTAKEQEGNLSFLYTVQQGPTAKSFGLQVAKLAGIPPSVIRDASKKLLELEKNKI